MNDTLHPIFQQLLNQFLEPVPRDEEPIEPPEEEGIEDQERKTWNARNVG